MEMVGERELVGEPVNRAWKNVTLDMALKLENDIWDGTDPREPISTLIDDIRSELRG